MKIKARHIKMARAAWRCMHRHRHTKYSSGYALDAVVFWYRAAKGKHQ